MRTHAFYIPIIIAMGVVIFILFHKYDRALEDGRQKDSVIAEKNDTIKYHTNLNGQIVAEKNAAVVDLNNFKASYPKLVSDLNKKLDIRAKDILAALQAGFTAHGSGTVKVMHDTIKALPGQAQGVAVVDLNDGYLKLQGTVYQDVIDYVDYKYEYSDTLLVAIDRKKSFFKGETITVSGALSNKNAKIKSITGVSIQTIKPKRFNISVGITYSPFNNTFIPGVSAGYALIRF